MGVMEPNPAPEGQKPPPPPPPPKLIGSLMIGMSAKMTRSKPYMRAGEPETEEPIGFPFPSKEEWEATFKQPYPLKDEDIARLRAAFEATYTGGESTMKILEEPMKERYLRISGDLWVEMLKGNRPKSFQVIKNALPEDAKCVGDPVTIVLKITSSVFRDDDPVDLPIPILKSINSD